MAVSTDIAATERPDEDSLADLYRVEVARERKSRLPLRMRWALLISVGLLSLGGYYAVWQASDVNRAPEAYGAYLALFIGLFALYLFACYLVLSAGDKLPHKPALALVGVVSVLARGLLLPAPPTLSNDMYRYLWDGRVMAAGVSPYQYAPGAPQLAGLRSPDYDRAIWQYINRKNAITIYPAGAEIFYAGVYRLAPDSIIAMKTAMVTIDLASCAMLALLLGMLRMSPARAVVYAWSPLPIIEFGSSGHIEALSVFWTLAALLAGVFVVRRYGHKRSGGVVKGMSVGRATPALLVAAVCLGGAMLVKLIPALLLAGWFRRFGWRLALASLAVFGVVSLIFIEAYGGYVSPFLATYLGSEESNAPLYFILKYAVAAPLGIPDGAVRLLLGGLLVLFALYVLARRESGPHDFLGKSFLLVAAYLFLATSAHAWYAAWLLLFVPLFLPPGGLTVFGEGGEGGEEQRRNRQRRRGYGVAFAALAYTGLVFLGYLGFAFRVPILPWPVVTLQFSLVLGTSIISPLWGRLLEKRRGKAELS